MSTNKFSGISENLIYEMNHKKSLKCSEYAQHLIKGLKHQTEGNALYITIFEIERSLQMYFLEEKGQLQNESFENPENFTSH